MTSVPPQEFFDIRAYSYYGGVPHEHKPEAMRKYQRARLVYDKCLLAIDGSNYEYSERIPASSNHGDIDQG